MGTDSLLINRRIYGKKISWTKRKSEDVAEKARLSLENDLLSLTVQCNTLQTQSKMDSLCQKYSEHTSREFTVSARQRPGRYKFYWTDELDDLAKERTSAHRAAKLLNTTEA